jgi:hypothetical protein
MGFTPAQVNDMSLWEFTACVDGWNRAHGDNKPEPPSDEEYDALLAQFDHENAQAQ